MRKIKLKHIIYVFLFTSVLAVAYFLGYFVRETQYSKKLPNLGVTIYLYQKPESNWYPVRRRGELLWYYDEKSYDAGVPCKVVWMKDAGRELWLEEQYSSNLQPIILENLIGGHPSDGDVYIVKENSVGKFVVERFP